MQQKGRIGPHLSNALHKTGSALAFTAPMAARPCYTITCYRAFVSLFKVSGYTW